MTRSQPLSEPLAQFRFAELVKLQETFFAQIDALHVGRILRRWAGDSAGDDYRVGLEDDAVVDDLVDGEGGQVVVLDDGALVDRVPAWCVSIELLGVSRCTDFRRMLSESRSARTTLRRVSWSFFRVMASSHTCTAAPRSPRRYPRRRA